MSNFTEYCSNAALKRVYIDKVCEYILSDIELSLDGDLEFDLECLKQFLRKLEKESPKMIYEFLPKLRIAITESINYKQKNIPAIEKQVIMDTLNRCCSKSTFYPYIYDGFVDVIEKLKRY